MTAPAIGRDPVDVADPRASQMMLTGPRHFSRVAFDLTAPAPHEVLVRLEGCGVCASSLPVWEGRPWFAYPLPAGAPGHEGWGRIEAVGSGVTSVVPGDRVATLSATAFATHAIMSERDVVLLPEALDDQPFPGEPLGCVMNVLERADIRAGQTVVVVGVGFIGAALVSLAARRGARVFALSRRAYAREVAHARGARAVFPLTAEGLHDALGAVGGDGAERVVEAVGSQHALDAATKLCGTRARLVIAGYHQDSPRTVDMQQWNWRGLDVINAHERDPARYRRGIEAAADAVLSGQLDSRGLFTHALPLDRLNEAFALLADRPTGFLKAMVTVP